ncbi:MULTISPECIES: TIGR03915 family putative DNA repair protein [Arcobacteraceae]|uniref:DNA metabolism protein n=1 Tax=Poseidonibacter parvus TaxID=1850254 RepID=A0A1P8KKJ4_9BACT|nr:MULTISPECIES: TIGR03915 family putative DNA repair protein [Arcobacteraceae]APW65055.1 DNA metabolism protein [Poseidonibacter parvus]
MILVYDKSFEGFLTLVFKVYYEKLKPIRILKEMPNELFLDDFIVIENNEEHSQKVLDALKKKFSKDNFQRILNIFMCDSKDFELDLLNYIIIGFKNQKELANINNSSLFNILNIEKELFRHIHKMEGFLRFEELDDGTLYAKMQTKFNVAYFLGKHFFKRLNNQKYIIHDINRKIAFIKNDDFLGIQNIASYEEPKLSEDEEKFKKLWSQFFKSVSIESKKNDRCQKNQVPLLYRTYMSEFYKR